MMILLDIDGVMIPLKSWKAPELHLDGFYKFDVKAVNELNKLIEGTTTIMLTTSHRFNFTLDEWKEIFKVRGINAKQISILPYVGNVSRREEIEHWLDNNDVKDFIIIDDDKSLNDLPSVYKDRLILVNSMVGLK